MQTAVEITSNNARAFTSLYYRNLDNIKERMNVIPGLYAPDARVSWNGNPLLGQDFATFLAELPPSRTDVQTLDAHPIAGTSTNGSPFSILLTVSGQQLHGSDPTRPAPPFPPAPDRKTKYRPTNLPEAEVYALPRVFNQVFVLSPIPGDANALRIVSDSFRFVG